MQIHAPLSGCPALATGRRGFLVSTAAALTVLFRNRRRQLELGGTRLLDRVHVAGFQYHAGPGCLGRLSPGDFVVLQAEPGNPHDRHAVRVCWNGRLLGYVPRSGNRAVSRLLRQGARIEAAIVRIKASRPPWEKLQIEITTKS